MPGIRDVVSLQALVLCPAPQGCPPPTPRGGAGEAAGVLGLGTVPWREGEPLQSPCRSDLELLL